MKIFKVGDLIRHINENSNWIWRIISINEMEQRYYCELTKDIDGSYRMYNKGYRDYIHISMATLIKSNNKRNYLPEWL